MSRHLHKDYARLLKLAPASRKEGADETIDGQVNLKHFNYQQHLQEK